MIKHSAPSIYLTIYDGVEQQASGCCWLSLTPDGVGDGWEFLPNSGTFLADFCLHMLKQDFIVRFDLPGQAFASHSTTVVRDANDLTTMIEGLPVEAQSGRLYPSSVWILPRKHFAEATKLVEKFQHARGDSELFNRIVRLGGGRLAVWRSFFDLNIGCQAFEWSVDILLRAAHSIPGKLLWAGDTSMEFRARHPIPD